MATVHYTCTLPAVSHDQKSQTFPEAPEREEGEGEEEGEEREGEEGEGDGDVFRIRVRDSFCEDLDEEEGEEVSDGW